MLKECVVCKNIFESDGLEWGCSLICCLQIEYDLIRKETNKSSDDAKVVDEDKRGGGQL